MQIPQEIIDGIRQQLTSKEVCGLITDTFKVYKIPNVSKDPTTFLMSKLDYVIALNKIKEDNESVLAVYHTHPFSDSTPSTQDLAYFSRSNYSMLIVSHKDYTYYAKTS